MKARTAATLTATLALVACSKGPHSAPEQHVSATSAFDRKSEESAPAKAGSPPEGHVAASRAPAPPGAAADDGVSAEFGEKDSRLAARAPTTAMAGGGASSHDHEARRGQGSGSIKAGEWDDNANYREFQRYLGSVAQPIQAVDVRARRFVVVRDVNGKAVPHCPVTVSDEAQHSVTLTTTASGRAILFPHAEGLTGRAFVARTTCQQDHASSSFALTDDSDGTVDLRLSTARNLGSSRAVDVAFVLDTTGSMGEEIASVKATIQKVATTLSSDQLSVRIGLVEYKDRGDAFVTKVYPMSGDLAGVSRAVEGIVAGGGGDLPENMNAGLHVALRDLDWSRDAVTRAAFIIGDAPPHLDYPDEANYAADMKQAAHRGIQLFTVAASGMDALGQAVFRQMSAYTGATNLFVLRGGAGPQSVGGGDPTSSCGGTQTQYASGNLDALIVGKIKRELKSLDVDPMRIPGLVTDENARPCDQRVTFWQ